MNEIGARQFDTALQLFSRGQTEAAIRLLTDSILQTDKMDMETVRDFVTDIGSEAERLSRITEDLLRLTRLDSDLLDAPETVEVAPVLEQEAATAQRR